MPYDDMFKPYSRKLRGDLATYLREHDMGADNSFVGFRYFFAIRDLGFMIPGFTSVRVSRTPIPDISYTVNDTFQLESFGEGSYNMSNMGAPAGIYDPKVVLAGRRWSIHNLDLDKTVEESVSVNPTEPLSTTD